MSWPIYLGQCVCVCVDMRVVLSPKMVLFSAFYNVKWVIRMVGGVVCSFPATLMLGGLLPVEIRGCCCLNTSL